jgi:hypothetical protein
MGLGAYQVVADQAFSYQLRNRKFSLRADGFPELFPVDIQGEFDDI